MLEKIKVALRISHNLLDVSITESINAARAEMVRVGISKSKVLDMEDPLILAAIKTYVLWEMGNDTKMMDGYFKSWQYQIENLRNSVEYMEKKEDV